MTNPWLYAMHTILHNLIATFNYPVIKRLNYDSSDPFFKCVYLCHEECARVDHIQEVPEPTKKCVLREGEDNASDKQFDMPHEYIYESITKT